MYDDISSFPRSYIKKEHITLTKIKQEHIQMEFFLEISTNDINFVFRLLLSCDTKVNRQKIRGKYGY